MKKRILLIPVIAVLLWGYVAVLSFFIMGAFSIKPILEDKLKEGAKEFTVEAYHQSSFWSCYPMERWSAQDKQTNPMSTSVTIEENKLSYSRLQLFDGELCFIEDVLIVVGGRIATRIREPHAVYFQTNRGVFVRCYPNELEEHAIFEFTEEDYVRYSQEYYDEEVYDPPKSELEIVMGDFSIGFINYMEENHPDALREPEASPLPESSLVYRKWAVGWGFLGLASLLLALLTYFYTRKPKQTKK